MTNQHVLAIPSTAPGGMEAPRSGHFGRCDVFTMIHLDGAQISQCRVVSNVEHSEGGCLVPVQLLQKEGATSIVVGGIGMRPLVGFQSVGIDVLVGTGETVADVVKAYLAGEVRPIDKTDVCGGHG